MGLSDVQCALAILLTNGPLRARFEADPQQVGRELDLNAADIALLMTFSTQEVTRCARSLQAKRWLEIEKLLPLSVRTAQMQHVPLSTLFQQFSQAYTPHGAKRHAQDAIAFAAWVAQQPGIADWLSDLLRYEATWLTANLDTRPRFCLVRRFRFPVHRINKLLSKQSAIGSAITSIPVQPIVAVWTRLSPNSRILFGIMTVPLPNTRGLETRG